MPQETYTSSSGTARLTLRLGQGREHLCPRPRQHGASSTRTRIAFTSLSAKNSLAESSRSPPTLWHCLLRGCGRCSPGLSWSGSLLHRHRKAQTCFSIQERAGLGRIPMWLGSKPNTTTLLGVRIKTLPFATIGVMNLLPENWSRPPAAWLEL